MKSLVMFLCAGAVLFLADVSGVLQTVRPNLERAIIPMLKSAASVRQTVQAPFQWLSFRRDLENDLQVLEKDRARLLSENEQLHTQLDQYKDLQKAKVIDPRFVPSTLILASQPILPIGAYQG
ncbi:MAG TPA: hypothetical protein VJ246_03815, partial [Patescibacteria group bacterium]|nr:hypothetical protein [Patescibacteria group bacterium]